MHIGGSNKFKGIHTYINILFSLNFIFLVTHNDGLNKSNRILDYIKIYSFVLCIF
jgi:hypothetical protein